MLYNVGTICVKIAGRDAGKKCVVVDILDTTHVLIDGQTRRRKCNMLHLEPLLATLAIKKGADTLAVTKAFEAIGVIVRATTAKKPSSRPIKIHTQKATESAKKSKKTSK